MTLSIVISVLGLFLRKQAYVNMLYHVIAVFDSHILTHFNFEYKISMLCPIVNFTFYHSLSNLSTLNQFVF